MNTAGRFLAQLAGAACAAACIAAARAQAADFAVGEAQITVARPADARGEDSRHLHIIVWYPADSRVAMQPMAEGPPSTPFFLEGAAAPDAAMVSAPGQFPLIVASHGSGSTAMEMGWLAAELAARGYIVAAVDHPGNNALAAQTVAGITLTWLRAGDLSQTIDAVLADPRFGARVDRSHIGAAGFSIGGNSVLELAGARTDLSALHAYCAQKPQTPVCSGQASNRPGIAEAAAALALTDSTYRDALAAAGSSYRDPRVKAVFSIAPALGPQLTPASLKAIAIPIDVVAGSADPVVPVSDNAVPVAATIPGAQLHLLASPIGHFTFVTQCAPAGSARFAVLCADTGSVRADAHAQAIALALGFFTATFAR